MTSQNDDISMGKGSPVSTAPLIMEEGYPVSGDAELAELREYFYLLLHELDWDLGPEYQPAIAEIRSRIDNAKDWNQLRLAAGTVRAKLTAFAHLMMTEREESSQFILEVVRRLMEVEAHLKASVKGTVALYKENEGFATSLIGGIDKIQDKTKASTDLNQVKDLVLAGLDKFKTVVQINRDQQRQKVKSVTIELDQMRGQFRQMQDQLSRVEQENQNLSNRLREDPLTGAHNRLALEEKLNQEIGLVKRGQRTFSILMVDLDNFKKVNDTHGHAIGDQCLIEIVAKLKQGIRVSDMLARYGGEEFVVILPASSGEEARITAEKLRQAVANTEFTVRGLKIPVTISIGATIAQATDTGPMDVFARADRALYEAKDAGRNRVRVG